MPNWYMEQLDGSAIALAGEYPDATTADTAANALGIFGDPVEASVWESGAAYIAATLGIRKHLKVLELRQEAKTRIKGNNGELDDALLMLDTAIVVRHMIKNAQQTLKGEKIAAIAQAYVQAKAVIDAMTDAVAVDAFNVVTGPAWPAP